MADNSVIVFAKDVLERAVKTAAQAALLTGGADKLNVLHANWQVIVGMAAGGFVTSILTSFASLPLGDKATASLVKMQVASDVAPAPVVTAVAPDAISEAQKIYPMP